MTLRRFKKLADSYGGDLKRWPEGVRAQGSALLERSTDARRIFARAADLDEAIAAAGAARNARIWGADRADAALKRLHSSVAARTRSRAVQRNGMLAWIRRSRSQVAPFRRAGWVGLATAASIAVVAGLSLGILYSPAPPSQSLFSSLQPAPFQSLAD
jgi:hypothetical protein